MGGLNFAGSRVASIRKAQLLYVGLYMVFEKLITRKANYNLG